MMKRAKEAALLIKQEHSHNDTLFPASYVNNRRTSGSSEPSEETMLFKPPATIPRSHGCLELILSEEGYNNNMDGDGITFTDDYNWLKMFTVLQRRHNYGINTGLLRITTSEMDFPQTCNTIRQEVHMNRSFALE